MPSSIVITSINPPTKAIYAYAQLDQYHTIVVGDVKSPAGWHCANIEYLTLEDQAALGFRCEQRLPTGHYCRKNIGYIKAIRSGADIIIDTDDDNIPYENFGSPSFAGNFDNPIADNRWINPYRYFTNLRCWPRGLPLNAIRNEKPSLARENFKVSVWQGLADHEPDVDAIYRLIENKTIIFEKRAPIVLRGSQFCPTNSQNTTFSAEAFPLLYLPHTVTFRFTDILRGLILQQILAAAGKCIGFHGATVYQERNTHDLMSDFASEIPCYLYAEKIPEIVQSAIMGNRSIPDNLFEAYSALLAKKIVQSSELECLEGWLQDLST